MKTLYDALWTHVSFLESSLPLLSSSESLALAVSDMRESLTLCKKEERSKSGDIDFLIECAAQYVFCLGLLEARTCLSFPSYQSILDDFDPMIKTRCGDFATSFLSAEQRPSQFIKAIERERRRAVLKGVAPEKGMILAQSLVKELVGLVKISIEEKCDEDIDGRGKFHPTFSSSGPPLHFQYQSFDIDVGEDEISDAKQVKVNSTSSVSSTSRAAKVISIASDDAIDSFPLCLMVIDVETKPSRFTFKMS